MAWTSVELRAIADGEAAADVAGVIPPGLKVLNHDAWRAGYARGWSGLGDSGQPVSYAKSSFREGWKLGMRSQKPQRE